MQHAMASSTTCAIIFRRVVKLNAIVCMITVNRQAKTYMIRE